MHIFGDWCRNVTVANACNREAVTLPCLVSFGMPQLSHTDMRHDIAVIVTRILYITFVLLSKENWVFFSVVIAKLETISKSLLYDSLQYVLVKSALYADLDSMAIKISLVCGVTLHTVSTAHCQCLFEEIH